MADIFLSYAHKNLETAKSLAKALEARGWSVWWDRDLLHGENFRSTIQRQLDEARCVVVLWSTAANQSSFVEDEAAEGRDSDRLVPVLIEPVKPPLGFRGTQSADLTDWRAQRGHAEFSRLVKSITSKVTPSLASTEANTPSDLRRQLEAVATKATQGSSDIDRNAIEKLEQQFGQRWGGLGGVAESFGSAWASVGDLARALVWYERALAADDGGGTVGGIQQLANLRIRLASDQVRSATAARGSVASALAIARTSIQEAINILEKLGSLRASMSLESLWGNAYKRLALLENVAGRAKQESQALLGMHTHFERAEKIGLETKDPYVYYATLNKMSARLALQAGRSKRVLDPHEVSRLRTALSVRVKDEPDFWTLLALIELDLFDVIGTASLTRHRDEIERRYRDLLSRIDHPARLAAAFESARLVLVPYTKRANRQERDAAESLMRALQPDHSGPAGKSR